MTNEADEQAFKRSPAIAVMSILWAIALGGVGAANLTGRALGVLLCLVAAALLLVNFVWAWRTPYVRMDSGGLTAYPTIVSRPRSVAWADVQRVQGMAGGRLCLLGKDGAARVNIRMKTVTMDQRADLIGEIERRSGRRLHKAAAAPIKIR
jgi:hypothetical protein